MKKLRHLLFVLSAGIVLASCGPKDSEVQTSLQGKQASGITVSVSKGVATLTGEVPDEAAKAAAEETARKEKGVKSVVNNLTVFVAPVVEAPMVAGDEQLTASVRDAVKDHPTVNASVSGGVVTLTGSISRAKLGGLMQTLQSLNPKKIESGQLVKN